MNCFLPDSDTNSHNEEPRSSGPVVITRAVINIKSNGEAISEATKLAKVPEPSKPTNGSTKLTRNRRLTKKTMVSSNQPSSKFCLQTELCNVSNN